MEKESNKPSENIGDNNEDEVFRSAVINAWINSKMERDKSLLNLSSGGIGLLVTFLNFKDSYSNCEIIFYGISFFAFLACIGSVLYIFTRNPDYLERLLKEDKVENDDVLGFFDYSAVISFSAGVLSTTFIGILNLF